MPNELWSRKEVAHIFGVKTRTIWHWEKRGVIKVECYVTGHPRYSIEEIERVAVDKQTIFTKSKTQPHE